MNFLLLFFCLCLDIKVDAKYVKIKEITNNKTMFFMSENDKNVSRLTAFNGHHLNHSEGNEII